MKFKCLATVFVTFSCSSLIVNGQSEGERGLPFVTNFSPKIYQAYPQIFSITEDNKGLMYFGNQNYTLQYDGVRWRKIDCGKGGQIAVRSLAKNKKGIIYYAAIGDFGYMAPDSVGQTQSYSLLKYIPDSLRSFNDIWTIYPVDDGVYFQARERIFRFKEDSSGHIIASTLKSWEPGTRFMYAFYLDGTYFVHQLELGLFKMVNDSLELIPGSEFLGKERMQVMLPYNNNGEKQYLLGMFYSGLYTYDGKQFRAFSIQADSLLNTTLYKAAILRDGSYALALAGKGLLIIDKTGKTIQLINRSTGLQDESVYAVYPDSEGNIWLGLDNGISRIETASPLTQFSIQSGVNTASLSVRRFQGTIYLGTTNGMLRFNEKTSHFGPISEVAQNQVFSLLPDNDQMLVATDGLFAVKDEKVKLLRASVSGNLQIAALHVLVNYPDILLTGDALQGVIVFTRKSQNKNNASQWEYAGAFAGINQQVWTFAEDNKGTIWAGTQNGLSYRLKLFFDEKGKLDLSKSTADRFGIDNGLPAYCGPVFSIKGEVYFPGDSAIYKFDKTTNKFFRTTEFGSFPNGGGKDENYMTEDYAGRVWVRMGKESLVAIPQPGGSYRIDKTSLLPIAERTVSQVYPEKNGTVWICTTDGLVRFDEHVKKNYDQSYNTLIRLVTAGNQVLNTDANQGGETSISLASKNNSLRFEYAAPFFEQEEKTKYQTWLEGFEPGWSDWGNNYYKEYTNLAHGDYKFHVRAMNVYQKISNEAVYDFTVNPPWFQTWWAYLLYALAAISIVYLVVRYRTNHLHKKQRELENIVSERTQELSQRVEELAVINSVQEALVSAMNMQAIYDLVGERIRDVFNAQAVIIATFDHNAGTENFKYGIENGERFYHGSRPLDKLRKQLIESRQKILIKNTEEGFTWFGGKSLPGTKPIKSGVFMPLTVGEKITGYISLQNVDKDNAFTHSDVRLLETLANSMSVALENARLFDETNRLLKETEQRTAELSVINSVQEGLAKELHIDAIYNLVGNKLSQVMETLDIDIRIFSPETNQVFFPYFVEHGKHIKIPPIAMAGISKHVFHTGQTLIINENLAERVKEFGSFTIAGTQTEKALLAVPIMAGSQVMGMVCISNYEQENSFGDSEVRLLQTVVSAMSVALQNAKLFDETNRLLKETEQRTAELAVINNVQDGLVREMDMQGIYDLVGDRLQNLFSAQAVIIASFDLATRTEHFNYVFENGEKFNLTSRPISDMRQLLIDRKRTIYIETEEAARTEFGITAIGSTKMPKSLLFVPLLSGNEVRGYVSLQNIDIEHAFSRSDIRLLETLANSMTVALQNARLFDETTALLAESKQRATELSTVNSISKALASQLDPTDLIKLVGDKLKDLFKANIVYLALINQKTKIIHFPYQYGDDLTPIKLGEGLTSKIILTKEPLLINKDVKQQTAQLGVKRVGIPASSYLGVPIPIGDEIIGVLSVQSTEHENMFNENDLRLLSTIAASVGVALRNATLFEEVQHAKMEAETARKTAEKANEAKSAFLSTVSHELRTPLTSVLGFAKIIRKRLEEKIFPLTDKSDPKTEKIVQQIAENLEVVVSEGERLTTLINDVLDLAKIEAGKMEWNLENVQMGEIAERAIAATTSLFDERKVVLKKEIGTDLPPITGDRDKLIQVMVNLISNAVKFTPAGSVTCKVQLKDKEIIVAIVDTGIGIAPEDHKAVFEQFKQVGGDTLTDKPKGTGLGLPICKEIIEHHGGRIWLESEHGKGSTFFFALPIVKPEVKPMLLDDLVKQLKERMAQSRLKTNGKGMTILVVDDEDSIRSLLRQELGDAGYHIEEARNGKEALAKVRVNHPDLIILDIMMPEMNGFDVAAILKNDPQTMDIPIIVLSIVQDKARGYRIGVDRYLTKPIDTTALFAEVGTLLEQGKSKKKVLVVDEDSAAVKALSDVLQAKGFAVVESDGKELVEKAVSSQPDIIILNSVLSGKQEIVQSLRFEKGLENVLFLIYNK